MNRTLSFLITSIFAALLIGCASHQAVSSAQAKPQSAQQSAPPPTRFDSPDAAIAALRDASQKQDATAMRAIFGAAWDDLQTEDAVADANNLKSFAQHVGEQLRAESTSENSATVLIGKNDWPMPVPLLRGDDGKWYFDTDSGKAAILARKIGSNELAAIDVCREFVFAQRQYATQDHDGSGVLKYAQRLLSHTGKRDGLFWPVDDGEPQSPFGPLVAQAEAEGYGPLKGAVHRPFHGYYFRILNRQGPDAPGGKYEYVINGNMIGGFAMISWPDKYGASGVMTFVVNQQGQVFEKDLGEKSDELAPQIREYNPDKTWTPVKE